MAILNPGDTVTLKAPVKPSKRRDTDDNSFYQAIEMDEWDIKTDDVKPPYKIFNIITGVYLGERRISVHDKRAARNVLRMLFHRFLFGTKEVMIEPKHVDIFVSFKEIAEMDDDEE